MLVLLDLSSVNASFSDVPEGHKYSSDIQYLQQFGLVQDTRFKPDTTITKGEFAKWLLKSSGFNGEGYIPRIKKRFVDVKYQENTYAPYIYKLLELGIVEADKGKLSYFHPKDEIKRIDALNWMFQVGGVPVPKIFDAAAFEATDVTANSRIAPVVAKALQLGVVNPGKVSPYKKLKRGEAAHFIKVGKSAAPNLTVTIMPSMSSDIIENQKFDILAGAWNRIFSNYLHSKDLDKDKLMYGAIEGMVKELGDKYSDFERPGDNSLTESLSGEVEGIGAVLQMKDDMPIVVAPIPDSPAEKAGLLPNDIITKVDDVDIKGMTLSAVVTRIKGKRDTRVKITLTRGEKTLEFTITRAIVKIVSTSEERTNDNISIISINNFGENTTSELAKIIGKFAQNQPKGIVIDLRNNPGGYLDVAVEVAGYFVKSGDKVTGVRYSDREETMNSSGSGELANYKIITIINAGSASASEILAGALQDYGISKIIGEKSFGKGTVQEISSFSDESNLKITVAEWLTPKGHSIDKNGITPNLEVKLTDEDRTAKRDPQLDEALAELRK